MDHRVNHYLVNKNKKEIVKWDEKYFACYAIKTCVATENQKLNDIIEQYVKPVAFPGDILFVSEKMVACTQGKAIPVDKIKPGVSARILSRFVTQSPHGIGLAMPETMQCAINECGLLRILAASAAGLAGKILHKKGWFYKVAGTKAASVDGPCSYTLPPYNHYVVLSPDDPDAAAVSISKTLGGNLVLIIDANDFGCTILGSSRPDIDHKMFESLLKQNPLGQSDECTPVGFFRPLKASQRTKWTSPLQGPKSLTH